MQIIKQIHNKNRIRHDHAKEKQEVRKEKIKQIKDNPFSFQLKKLRQKFEHDILIAAPIGCAGATIPSMFQVPAPT